MKDQQIRRLLQAGKKNQNQGGIVAAHLNASGIATPRSGDDEAPFVKENPFVTSPEQYWSQVDLPDAAVGYITGPVIDVDAWRTLIVYVFCTGQLSLVPQAAPDLEVTDSVLEQLLDPDLTPLTPIGVIDPTLTPVAVAGAPGSFASRTMYGTELRNPPNTTLAVTLAFDVSMYSAFNFLAAQVAPGEAPAQVSMTYALSM